MAGLVGDRSTFAAPVVGQRIGLAVDRSSAADTGARLVGSTVAKPCLVMRLLLRNEGLNDSSRDSGCEVRDAKSKP